MKEAKRRRQETKGNPEKPRKEWEVSSCVHSRANTFAHPHKKFDYLSGRCRRQSCGSQMLLARGELKDIVIPRRHTVLSLSNLTRYYTRLQSRHRRRRRRRENDSAEREGE